jgi:mannonate dehydratase
MKLGFGLYRHMLKRSYFEFARQVGATHLVVHLVDYFKGGGTANSRGINLLVRFDPVHWYDVLLDGPRKREQLEISKR